MVSTLNEPLWSTPLPSGQTKRPSPMAAMPGMMRGVTLAMTRVSPRTLNTRTVSPFLMPRGPASSGLIHTIWREASSTSTLP